MSIQYLAGFFDGEGNVGIYRGGGEGGRTLRVQLSQNATPESLILLSAVQDRWGGTASKEDRAGKRPTWHWQIGGAGADLALHDLEPHVYLKRAQVQLAIAWFAARPARRRDTATGRHISRSPEDIALTEQVAGLLADLKTGARTDSCPLLAQTLTTLRARTLGKVA